MFFHLVCCRYESTIVAQFFGHTHKDHFELFYDDKSFKRPTSIAYIGPSVTTYAGLNPGYRIYTVDGLHENTTWVSETTALFANLFVLNRICHGCSATDSELGAYLMY